VLNPIRSVDQHIMDDTDLAGPIIFCLLFATFLLLVRAPHPPPSRPYQLTFFQGGKSHFGYVYGFILLGTVSLHFILNLMSQIGVNFIRTASVLGYCLLPLVLISAVGVVLSLEYVPFFGEADWGSGFLGYSLAAVAISWCTYSASAIFVAVLQLTEMRALVAYPVGLFCIPLSSSLSIFLRY
jgi:protein YIPF5/7